MAKLTKNLTPYLCFSVRPSPGHLSVSSQLGDFGVELVGQNDGQGHALLGLVSGVAEHEPLVPSSNVVFITVHVHPLGNVRTLLLQGDQHVAGLVVKACKAKQFVTIFLNFYNSLRRWNVAAYMAG